MFWHNTNNEGETKKKKNSVALVRERTIPTERPPPVGEVSANFCGLRGVTWSAQRVPTAVNLCFLDVEPLLFYSSSSSIEKEKQRILILILFCKEWIVKMWTGPKYLWMESIGNFSHTL